MNFWSKIVRQVFRREGRQCSDEPILLFVEKLAQEDPKLVLRVIRSLFEQKVAEYRNSILIGKEAPDVRSLDDVWPFFQGENWHEPPVLLALEPVQIDMAENSILSCPWNDQRHLSALMHHGKDRNRGRWRQDNNHSIVWYEPIKIGFVQNGMHSTAQGVLAREGVVVPENTFDISSVLRRYEVQGNYYVRLTDGARFYVRDKVWSAIFTAGRCMVIESDKRGLSSE